MVYAIVRAGGHQEKVSVGDIITVNRMKAKAGDSVELDAVLLVDGETVTTIPTLCRRSRSPLRSPVSSAVPRL